MTEHVYAILQKKDSMDGKYPTQYSLVYSTLYKKAMLRNLEYNKILVRAEDNEAEPTNFTVFTYVDDENDRMAMSYYDQHDCPTHMVEYYRVEMDIPCPSNVSLKNETGHIVLKINSENDLFFPKVVATYGIPRSTKHYSSGKDKYYCFNFRLENGAMLDFHYRDKKQSVNSQIRHSDKISPKLGKYDD